MTPTLTPSEAPNTGEQVLYPWWESLCPIISIKHLLIRSVLRNLFNVRRGIELISEGQMSRGSLLLLPKGISDVANNEAVNKQMKSKFLTRKMVISDWNIIELGAYKHWKFFWGQQ